MNKRRVLSLLPTATFVINLQSFTLKVHFYVKFDETPSNRWIIMFYLNLSTVIISVNISALISANCISCYPFKSIGAYYAPCVDPSNPMFTSNIPSGGFCQKNYLLKSESTKLCFLFWLCWDPVFSDVAAEEIPSMKNIMWRTNNFTILFIMNLIFI